MFTKEQKKWIVSLQTSEKHRGELIGPNNSESHMHCCCLGVYARCCEMPYSGKSGILFSNYPSNINFRDYKKYFLEDESGVFRSIAVNINGFSINSLIAMNDCKEYEFSHEFISKFLFTMPDRIFTNFGIFPHVEIGLIDFVNKVEWLAKEKEYDKITKEWKEEIETI